MKQALALILAGGTLGLAPEADAGTAPVAAHAFVFEGPSTTSDQPLLVDDDGDEGGWFWSNGGGSDEGNGGGSGEGNGGDSDDCSPQDLACVAGNAAPAGTVAPPKNGLFTDGTAPVVKSN